MGHLRDNGFEVTIVDHADMMAVKTEFGIGANVVSCHTAEIGDYIVEGHVPASAIKRMLEEAPDVKGISVPGMPMGSPGMEGPRSDPYDVLTFDGDGNTTVYESHR